MARLVSTQLDLIAYLHCVSCFEARTAKLVSSTRRHRRHSTRQIDWQRCEPMHGTGQTELILLFALMFYLCASVSCRYWRVENNTTFINIRRARSCPAFYITDKYIKSIANVKSNLVSNQNKPHSSCVSYVGC